jgi:hypothetical protein
MARIGTSPEGPLRLTIDHEILASPVEAIAFTDIPSIHLLPGRTILEFKYPAHLPAMFKRLIEEFRLEPRSISKYRLAVRSIGLTKKEEGVVLHA